MAFDLRFIFLVFAFCYYSFSSKRASGFCSCKWLLKRLCLLSPIQGLIWRSQKKMNHLLKAPFCVHPKTGRVCVPIDPEHCDEFDPTAVPTISQLVEELNMAELGDDDDNKWDRTSLGKSVQFFRSFLEPLLKSCKEEMENSYNARLQHSKNSLTW